MPDTSPTDCKPVADFAAGVIPQTAACAPAAETPGSRSENREETAIPASRHVLFCQEYKWNRTRRARTAATKLLAQVARRTPAPT